MKKFSFVFVVFVCIMMAGTGFAQDSLVTYDVPRKLFYSMHNDDFTVQIRNPGGQWMDLYEYKVQVDMDRVQEASMVYFDFSGTVEVKIRKNNGLVNTVDIRPLSYEITPEVKGNIIQFTLDKPRNISVEVDGDRLHNLHLFAQSIEENRPDPNDPNVVYFGPGVHEAPDKPGDVFQVKSGQTVYIHGGAAIRGKLLCNNVKNVRIIGRGIILEPERGVEIRFSENVEIDGIHVVNPKHYTVYGGQSRGLKIKNLTSFSCRGWSDGIDLMSCSDVEIDGVFMRNSDDCIAIYAHRWDFYGDARNYKISNSILWADIAHPTNIGAHGNTEHEGDTIENIIFSNIDILEHDEDDPCCLGAMAIVAADNNLVRNVTYENIRVEDIQEGRLFDLRVLNNPKYNTKSGRSIENIRFRNITYNGSGVRPSRIKGYNKDRMINGVTFENVTINGEKVTSPEEGDIIIGDFVKNVRFKK
ncbi:glycoside hydrolase family 28 protein [Sinomicrobium kalidii]|uniref:glycosyl hydrolase family 28 protein n=1 Tax=Sinomicrobium kalidii TaxID=2900738 RepID=UPI001E495766|nr:glycosyl hydrolase family 28 protein [Sinomicrobium kalidii]UGU18179.1 glycoside hydrolase family 28 protein [Sinomicrobium kalidii]